MVAFRGKEIVNSFRRKGGLRYKKKSRKATKRFKYLDYRIIDDLCDNLIDAAIIQDRRSAALLLMVQCQKTQFWKFISSVVKERLKESVLTGYFTERDKSVRCAIASVIVTIAKNDFAYGQWNKLMDPIIAGINSDSLDMREISLYLLNRITDSVGKGLRIFYIDLLYAFQVPITDRSSNESSYFILKIILQICGNFGPQEMDYFKPLLPSILLSVKVLVAKDEKKALDCIDICAKLLDFKQDIIGPYIETIFDICVKIFPLTKYYYKLRVKAMKIFTHLIEAKTEVATELFERKALTLFILHILFPLVDDYILDDVLDAEKSLGIEAVKVIQAMLRMNMSQSWKIQNESLMAYWTSFNRV